MTNHKIIATRWQIEAARRGILKVVFLPYDKPIIRWGDRLYFAEQWCFSNWGTDQVKQLRVTRLMGWQPAEAMPPEAAQYWFEITGFGESRLGMVTFRDFEESGLHLICPGVDYAKHERKNAWNESYPDTPWDEELWVQVLEVERDQEKTA